MGNPSSNNNNNNNNNETNNSKDDNNNVNIQLLQQQLQNSPFSSGGSNLLQQLQGIKNEKALRSDQIIVIFVMILCTVKKNGKEDKNKNSKNKIPNKLLKSFRFDKII